LDVEEWLVLYHHDAIQVFGWTELKKNLRQYCRHMEIKINPENV